MSIQQKGVSLIVVLIMMIVIGLTAASAMRGATSEQLLTNNVRRQSTAQQYAEAALRYCEAQLQLPDASRVSTLKSTVIPTATLALSGWEDIATWTSSTGRASATRTQVPVSVLSDVNVAAPSTLPECVVEMQPLSGSPTYSITVVTARGFSQDYSANADGTTKQGAVVWLQSILNM